MVKKTILLVAILGLIEIAIVGAHQTECNQNNDTLCVEKVRHDFESLDNWFGTQYETNCPLGTARRDFYCSNPDLVNKNIATRMLRTANYDVMNITQFLRIRWHTPRGHYKACGHVYHVEEFSMDTDLDSAHTIYTDSWILSHQPRIMFDAVPGHRYTIVAYDAGELRLGGIWTNLIGGDLAFGQVLFPYTGPVGAMYEKRNPFVFALFEQNGIVNVEGEKHKIFQSIRDNNGIYYLNQFINSAKLEGPVGIGYVALKSDAYGIQRFLDETIVNKCPHLVAKNEKLLDALKEMGYELTDDNSYTSYRGTFLTGLEYELKVTYFSHSAKFNSCCEMIVETDHAVVIDPESEEPVDPIVTMHEPEIQLKRIELQMHMQGIGRYYMLFMVDITNHKFSLEWQVANIRAGDSSSGDEVIPYRMPMPHWRHENRTYAFILVTQPTKVQANNMWVYTGGQDCPSEDFLRCHFNLGGIMKGMNAKLVGVSLFHSHQDAFTRAVMYGDQTALNIAGLNMYEQPVNDEEMVCQGIEGYHNPCHRNHTPCHPDDYRDHHHDYNDHHDHHDHHDDHHGGGHGMAPDWGNHNNGTNWGHHNNGTNWGHHNNSTNSTSPTPPPSK